MWNERTRLYVEIASATLFSMLFVLTLVTPDWIEEVFGVDPDRGSGALEWLIVASLLLATVGCGLAARRDWRRVHGADR
jgi:hypothetical protein